MTSHKKRPGGLIKQSLAFLRHLKGFTLIELLVVVAVVGLLSTVIASPIQSARKKARDAKKIAELKATQTALAQYVESNGQYPRLLSDLYPLYMPQLPDYATTTATPRDRFAYVTYETYRNTLGYDTSPNPRYLPVINPFCNTALSMPGYTLPPKVTGYHIGVHLDSYSQVLDTDEDCKNLSTLSSSILRGNCYTYIEPETFTCSYYHNFVSGMITPYLIPTSEGEFSGADTGTTTCSNVNDCVLDFSGHADVAI